MHAFCPQCSRQQMILLPQSWAEPLFIWICRTERPNPSRYANMLEPLGTRMRVPYKDAIKKTFEEIAVFLSSPRAQTAGPESLDKLAKGYAELFRISNGNNLEDIFAPIATLAPEYLGVPDVNGLLPGDYEISSPDAEVGCPVLAVTVRYYGVQYL